MDRRIKNEPSRDGKVSMSLQKKLIEKQKPIPKEPVPDIADLMNDWFFGTDNKAYDLTGGGGPNPMEDARFDDGLRNSSTNGRLTQEWLEEAKRIVASSPSRYDSPTRLVGSPRFAAANSGEPLSKLDRRVPLSRSARRQRAVQGFSGEIISKSAKHNLDKSESFEAVTDKSPASAVQKWFSNILRPGNANPDPKQQQHQPHHSSFEDVRTDSDGDSTVLTNLPRQPVNRKSRFQNDPSATQPVGKPIPSKRTFRTPATLPDNQVLSPPKDLKEFGRISLSTSSLTENRILSPPRNLIESAHRRTLSSSTCSLDRKSSRQEIRNREGEDGVRDLNAFLKEQRGKIQGIANGDISAKAKIVLSGSSNSTSSMVAAICYAWLLEKRTKKEREGSDGVDYVVVPVLNMSRAKMWKQKQAAWLFHRVGIDSSTLLFANEVDLESLMMAKQLSILVIGQDVLKTNGEVGSQCTILTDNYCEEAYDLLQISVVKKLLLAGILLDTKNLNISSNISMTRDAEAVRLLLVGSAPNFRKAFFDQLMQDQQDSSFLKALQQNYGKPPNESVNKNTASVENKASARMSTSANHESITQTPEKISGNMKAISNNTASQKPAMPKPAPTATTATTESTSRGKNKFFLAKWFGFGSK